MALLSDKEQKKQFKKEASQNPDNYYPTKALKRNGFHREQCNNCNRYFWTVNETKICGEPECNEGFQVVDNNPTQNKLSFIQVWEKIVELLEPRGYKPLKRYPVVARWNPTTDFTIASIAAFQPYVISGEVPPPAKKLLIPQFCLRFGDIENVGVTGSHCTGFVMIGQHQFVSVDEWDQEQAFQDILDFLLIGVGLDKKEISIQEDAWAGGGNYGPCMEFFSRGVELFNQVYMMFQQTPEGPTPLKLKVLDMGLGQERVAWFSQGTPNMYEAIFPKVLKKLRDITKIELDHKLYNKFSQYSAFLNIDEVDNLQEAWKKVADKINEDVTTIQEKIIPMTAIYSIAEHTRSLLFAISDGMLPSNVGGGYNLRIILRRALSFIDKFKWKIDLADVCEWHAEELFDIFPGVSNSLKEVRQILNVEKEKFLTTKEKAKKIVKNLAKKGEVTIDKLIELYDSNGIDPDMVKDALKKAGKEIKIPDNFYQLVISRHETQTQVHSTHKKVDIEVSDLPKTENLYFDDWEQLENSAKVLRINEIEYKINDEDDDDEEKTDNSSESNKIQAWACIVDRSLTYPTSGGQMHDIGTINSIPFIDALKVGPTVVHILSQKPDFSEGDSVLVKIDKNRRTVLTQHHSATHILNAAAREYLGSHINQAGAKKTLKKAHLDITHYESLSDEQIREIEKIANSYVSKAIQTNNRFMSRTAAEQKFGMRLYQGGAVPGTQIRIVEIPNVEVEACGGTHVNNTKQIGPIKIIKAQKIQDGIVRLTFTAGITTEELFKEYGHIKDELAKILETEGNFIELRAKELLDKWKQLRKAKKKGEFTDDMLKLTSKTPNTKGSISETLNELSTLFTTSVNLLVDKLEKMKQEWEEMKEEISKIVSIVGEENVKSLIEQATDIDNKKVICSFYENTGGNVLDSLAKNLLKEEKCLIIFLLGSNPGGFNFLAARDDELKDINLSKIIKDFNSTVKGKGGGKPDLVQGFIPKKNYSGNVEELFSIFKSLI